MRQRRAPTHGPYARSRAGFSALELPGAIGYKTVRKDEHWREEKTIMRNATLRIVLTATLLTALGSGCSKISGLFGGHHQGDSVAATQLDLNTAGRRELARLRGLTEADVERIIKNRPYSKKHELLDRGILDE